MRKFGLIAMTLSIIFAGGCRKQQTPPPFPTEALAPISATGTATPGGNTGGATLSLTAEQLRDMLDRKAPMVLVDVRRPEELKDALGKINGAINIPLSELPERYKELDPKQKIVLICRSGNRSTQAAKFLSEKGFKQVYNIEGGMVSWRAMVDAPKP